MSEVENKDEMFEFNQYLSFLDLEHHPDFKSAWDGQDKVAFEKVLMSMGVDLGYGWEITDCLHRSRFCQRVERGPRITFRERTDHYWIKNGMQLEDTVRETKSVIARVGMILAMNPDTRIESLVASGDAEEA